MRFQLLGPVRGLVEDRPINLGVRKQRLVLAMLALEVNTLVPTSRLVDLIWSGHPPASARGMIHTHVSGLRVILSHAGSATVSLLRHPAGYELRCDPDRVDVHRFLTLTAQARASGDDEQRLALLDEALGLWQGPALAGVASEELRARLCLHLDQARLTAVEDSAEALLRLGRPHRLVDQLTALSAEHPTRQRLTRQLMVALHRTGRTADALHAYERTRRRLAHELGIDPDADLQELHRTLLRGDPVQPSPPQPARQLPVPMQLPADVSAFTGRAAELAQLDTLLTATAGRAVVISAVSGTAGVGKTALAVHWAHRVTDRFPDGQLYVNLRGYDPDQPMAPGDALARLLTALGVPGPDIPFELDERVARYRTEIAGRRMLMVLDNAATAEQVRPLLPGAATCTVLVTSRDSLAGLVAVHGAHRIDLDLLPPDDAIALLRQLIGTRVDTEPDAAAALAEQCSRLPLALRVAAELAVSRPTTPLADLVTDLANQPRRLHLLDAGGDPRAAVTAVFSWSVRQLPPAAARAFGLLGLHPGPDFDPYAAAALTGTGLDHVRRTLAGLARAHLIHPTGPGRYGMHDLLRVYATTLATADHPIDDLRVALGRLFDYYLATAAAGMDTLYPAEAQYRPRIPPPATPTPALIEPDTARSWLESERPSLAAVAACTAAHGWSTHTVRLSTTLFRYLYGGHHTDAMAIHAHAHHAAEQAADPAGQAHALLGLGATHQQLGRYGPAAEHFQHGLALFRQAGDQSGQARILNGLCLLEWRLGRYGPAADNVHNALALFRQTGDQTGEATALNNLGIVEQHIGHYRAAADTYEQALALHRMTGDRDGEALALNCLGLLEQQMGGHGPAAEHHKQALGLFRALGNRVGEAHALDNLGTVHTRLGQPEQAAEHFQRALSVFREIGDRDGETWVLNGLGEAANTAGRPADALDHHTAALTIATHIGARDQQARAHAGLGHAQQTLGHPDTARAHYTHALALYADLGMPDADHVRDDLATLNAANPIMVR